MKIYLFTLYGSYESLRYFAIVDTKDEAREIVIEKIKINHADEYLSFFSTHNTLQYYLDGLEFIESFIIEKGIVCVLYEGE